MGAFKDRIVNSWLLCKSYLRYLVKAKENSNGPSGTESYSLKFEDNFTGKTVNRSIWYLGQPWGQFHPDVLYQYYGDTQEFININDGVLELYTRYKPKKFYDFKNSVSITIPYGIGLVNSKIAYKYGYYEIEAMLPEGQYLWPAIWITAVKTWPPEIDILESYSGQKGDYSNRTGKVDFENQPNVHYGFTEDGTKSSFGAISYPIPNSPSKRFVKYGLHWTKSFIKVYYDGYFVFQCTQNEVLDYFNRPDVEMTIILNNALTKEVMNLTLPPSVFRVKSVKYFSKT